MTRVNPFLTLQEWRPVPIIPKDDRVIPLIDLAVRTGRTPRYGGACRAEWWSVLHHSIAMYRLIQFVERPRSHSGRALLLYALMHDMHEAATGDIPSPFKTEAVRELQSELDQRFYNDTLSVEPPGEEVRKLIKVYDKYLLTAEGYALGPTYWPELFGPQESVHPEATGMVQEVRAEYPKMESAGLPNSPAVLYFLREVDHLVNHLGGPCVLYSASTR